ncbi:MAG: hypothetical protein LKI18_03465 [Prevotella sp.]|jgi:hypothetical protein|nr:hypothetical protein [Prevotella sp.]
MIDYISVTLYPDEKKPPQESVQWNADYSSGWSEYYLSRYDKRLRVRYHPNFKILRLDGSIPLFWQGHNFTFSNKEFSDAINFINGSLKVDLWKACVDAFEFGVIFETEMKPKTYILHHATKTHEKLKQNEKAKDNGNFRWWSDKNVSLKMYDAGKNVLMKQSLSKRKILQVLGWKEKGNFLKWEVHYNRPECLNRGVSLKLSDLVDPSWQEILKEDLYVQYQRLIPAKNAIITPDNKKDLSTAKILALELSEEAISQGHPAASAKKKLYARINDIPDEILTKQDKDARKRQIREIFDRIQEAPDSKWDLSRKIQEALDACE